MSILKRLLVEDLLPLLRRSSAGNSGNRIEETLGIDIDSDELVHPKRSGRSESGMIAVILNWKIGENDPFSVVNATVRQHLLACGKNVEIIEISEEDWIGRMAELVPHVEFAFTWQGLGSRATVGSRGENLWDYLKIPLICIHGDHPSHMPLNHQLESRYCFHLYANAEFARYSNRHFRKARSASVIDIPQLHREPRFGQRTGDYFMVAKNINDPVDTERLWQQRLDKPTFDAYMIAVETLKYRIAGESYVEIHDVLDELIEKNEVVSLKPSVNIAGYHYYHSQLDHYLRSHKSIFALAALRDFPVRVRGRGWDRIAQRAAVSHVFEAGRNMADSQDLYYTRFGLIDISPAKGLHDRTRRAMANAGAFLSSANLEDSFSDIAPYDPLFFSFRGHELPEKCAAVLHDPERHLELSQQFAKHYHDKFHFKDFVSRIDHLAKSTSTF